MKKIPTLFVRDWNGDRRYVTREVTPGCEWVINGEGTPTRKYDGTCVMFDGERWWARREVKKDKLPPPNFIEVEHDPETDKTIGWVPAEESPFRKFHAEAVRLASGSPILFAGGWPVGTYELIGPSINGNPENWEEHFLMFHSFAASLPEAPRDWVGLAKWLHHMSYEGVVWHHPDGRMVKIKKRDFRAPGLEETDNTSD